MIQKDGNKRNAEVINGVTYFPSENIAPSSTATPVAQHSGFADRVALVIGNDNYPTEPLKNAVNDARAMQQVLQELGFRVIFRQNADISTMRAAAVEFAKQMDGATAVVFFFAGHGIQSRFRNFIVPVDAMLKSEQEIAFFTIEETVPRQPA